VTLNGQKAALADLKPGMIVSVTLSDPTRLSRIAATTK
jgi:TusA-related sulfurtransferase